MKHQLIFLLVAGLLLLSTHSYAQSVGIGTETPNPNAILELVAPDHNQGLLVPRMTTAQRTAASFMSNLSVSDNGLMVYDEDENKFFFWINDLWVELSTGNVSGLPDQVGQTGKILTTDGNTALWSDLDFNTLTNIPTGIIDGDDDTQLTDADIQALGFVKTSDDADNDPTNEIQVITAGSGISISQTGDDFQVTNDAPDQTISIVDGGNGNVTIGGAYPNMSIDVADPIANEIAVTATVDLLSNNVQDALEELQGEITAAASAAIPDGAVVTSKLGNLAVTNEKVNDIDFAKITSFPADLADGDDVNDADASITNEVNTGMSLSGTTIQVTDANSTQGVDIGSTFATDAELTASDAADGDKDDTNEIQDISTDGTAGDISLSDGSSLTLNVDDADASTTNEVNTGMSLSGTTIQVTDANSTQGVDIGSTFATDAELTASDAADGDKDDTNEIQDISTDGTAGDISLSDGSSLTLNVDDADASTTNEVNTGMSLSGTTIQVTDANSTQGVDIGSTFATDAELTASDAADGDKDDTNEIQDISTDGTAGDISLSDGSSLTLNVDDADASTTNEVNTGMSLSGTTIQVTDANSTQGVDIGSTFATDAELAAINESQWTTNGTSVNYTTGNVNIGSGTVPTSSLQLTTNNASSTTPQLTLFESNATSDASLYFRRSGTNFSMGIDGTDGFFKMSGANTVGSNDRLIIDSQGSVGIGVTPNAQFHVQTNTIESTTVRLTNNNSGAGSKIGVLNELDNQGTSIKTGIWNDIDGTSGETGNLKGVYNVINPTSGTTYGVHSQLNSIGTGVRYGTFNDVRAASGNTSTIYGTRANMDHDGTGDSYAFYGQMAGTTSGDKYGVFMDAEDFNYFSGHLGIGDQSPDVELTIQSFDLNSTLPLIRMTSGAATSDAAISFETGGLGNDFIIGVDATDESFKISDAAVLGGNHRFVIDNTGNVGINESAPSAGLDVVGTTELNGAVDINSTLEASGAVTFTSTLEVTGLIEGANDVEIPAANEYSYASAKTKYVSFHPTEFKAMHRINVDTLAFITPNATTLYGYFTRGSGNQGRAMTPVNLPNGAVITQFDAWVVDNDATESSDFARVSLTRTSVSNPSSSLNISRIDTDQAFNSATVTQLTDNPIGGSSIIDNSLYSYRIVFTAPDDNPLEQLHGVRITYTVRQAD